MASVKLIYNTIRDLANKDARGFVTPDEFNSFAEAAQMSVFNNILNDIAVAARSSRASDPGRNFSVRKGLVEDLSTFSKKASGVAVTNGIAQRPADMYRVISVTTKSQLSLGRKRDKQVEIVYDDEKIDRILRSSLSAPSNDFPVALVSDSIEVFPENIRKINVRYYRVPTAPSVTLIESGGVEVISQFTDFELPDSYTMDLIVEIAKMVGVNLKEPEIRAYVQAPAKNIVTPKK